MPPRSRDVRAFDGKGRSDFNRMVDHSADPPPDPCEAAAFNRNALLFAFSEREEVFPNPPGPGARPPVLRRMPERPPVPAQPLRHLHGRTVLLAAPHAHRARDLRLPGRRALPPVGHVHPVVQMQRRLRPPERSGALAAVLDARGHAHVHGLVVAAFGF